MRKGRPLAESACDLYCCERAIADSIYEFDAVKARDVTSSRIKELFDKAPCQFASVFGLFDNLPRKYPFFWNPVKDFVPLHCSSLLPRSQCHHNCKRGYGCWAI